MDLSTVYNNLLLINNDKDNDTCTVEQYESVDEANQDVHLIWFNCIMFNGVNSDFGQLAYNLRLRWAEFYEEEVIEKLKQLDGKIDNADDDDASATAASMPMKEQTDEYTMMTPQEAENLEITLSEKRALVSRIHKLDSFSMGMICHQWKELCPRCIQSNTSNDIWTIDLDSHTLSRAIWNRLVGLVQHAETLKKKGLHRPGRVSRGPGRPRRNSSNNNNNSKGADNTRTTTTTTTTTTATRRSRTRRRNSSSSGNVDKNSNTTTQRQQNHRHDKNDADGGGRGGGFGNNSKDKDKDSNEDSNPESHLAFRRKTSMKTALSPLRRLLPSPPSSSLKKKQQRR